MNDDYPPYSPEEEAIICERWFSLDYKLVMVGSVRQTCRRKGVETHFNFVCRLKGTVEYVRVEGVVGK